ncbi:MAG: M48 family metalloprotease [Myxococcales bacterium]|nr:M48 family metalloprotease [Myxococcales bacterium]
MNPIRLVTDKQKHWISSLALITAQIALFGWVSYALAGPSGAVLFTALWLFSLFFSPRLSPRWLLRMMGGYRLQPWEAPSLFHEVKTLSHKAGLPQVPELFLMPQSAPNAMAVGSTQAPAIAVSEGLLEILDERELRGVLAHEISHIRNHDLLSMGLVESLGRSIGFLSFVGMLILFLQIPLILLGYVHVTASAVLTVLFAPTVGRLLQLALSRTREFDADLSAVELTQDPQGLASALQTLQEGPRGVWRLFFPAPRKEAIPTLLLSHPPTHERIERLLSLREGQPSVSPKNPTPWEIVSPPRTQKRAAQPEDLWISILFQSPPYKR